MLGCGAEARVPPGSTGRRAAEARPPLAVETQDLLLQYPWELKVNLWEYIGIAKGL